ATGEVIERFAEHRAEDVDEALGVAERAFVGWRGRSFGERGAYLVEAARGLRSRKVELARTMAVEMGKPVVEGEAEVEKCAWACEFYAEQAERMLAVDVRATEAQRSFVRFDPLGVVLAIMPWNFPLWQVFRFAAPALMAGNAAVLKHASNVPRCA